MQVLIVLALVACAAAFEPTDGVDQKCMMCGDPVMRTFDGQYHHFSDTGKMAFTSWKPLEGDRCKFEVDCVISANWLTPANATNPFVDWCGVAVWPHSNPTKFARNFVFGQNENCIGFRGQGVDFHGVNPDGHVFPSTDVSLWNSKIPKPAPGCTPYTFSKAGEKLMMRSDPCEDCGWAFDFYVRGTETCVVVWSQAGKGRDGQMEGPCGNMDGDKTNDAVPPPTSFDNDGSGFSGGTKLYGVCGMP